MKSKKLSNKELKLINTKLGLYKLLRSEKLNPQKVSKKVRRALEFKQKQEQFIQLQNWVVSQDKKVVVLFEGRDAAGKTGTIRKISEYINPRHYRIVALDKPSPDERKQWYFQRYINHLPKPGEMVFFDRSWYNRAVLEPVNGFCTQEEYQRFMNQVLEFEKMLAESDTYLIKFFLSIDKKKQLQRFDEIRNNPLRPWQITPLDEDAQRLWDDYSYYIDQMIEHTSSNIHPWVVVDANKRSKARIRVLEHILDTIPYSRVDRD